MFEVIELYRNGQGIVLHQFNNRNDAGTYRYERSRYVQQLSDNLIGMLRAGVPGYKVQMFLDGIGFDPLSVQGHEVREV